MRHDVETRLPFMDYQLVELALALPVRRKRSNGIRKRALRRISDGGVPAAIFLNHKDGEMTLLRIGLKVELNRAVAPVCAAIKVHLHPY